MPTSLNLLSLRKRKDLLAVQLEAEVATLLMKLDREVSAVE